jgi:hypothetical protein
MWFDFKELRVTNSIITAAMVMIGGRTYLRTEKASIEDTGIPAIFETGGGSEFWLTAQKLSSSSSNTRWLYSGDASTNWFFVQEYEGVGTWNLATGTVLNAGEATNRPIAGGVISANSAGIRYWTTDASALTGLNASQLSSGTIPNGRFPALGSVYPNALTNSDTRTIQLTALTASRMVLSDGSKNLTSAAASGSVPINADGTATTGAQLDGFITNHLVGGSYALVPANTTAFWAPLGNAVTNVHTSDVDMQTRKPIGTGFKIIGLWVKSSSAPSAGQTYTATVMTNGVATSIVATISGASATTASDFSHGINANAQGDSLGVKIVSSTTATSSRYDWDIMFINQ